VPKYKVGDRALIKLSGGRIVEATIKAVLETKEGIRLQVDFGQIGRFVNIKVSVKEAERNQAAVLPLHIRTNASS
jgi:hypothetical protein